MRFERTLEILMVHAQGEIGNVIVGGAPEIPGATILDKMNHINEVDDSLRRFVCFEPRANVAMTVNLLLPPCRPDADAAFIVLQPDRAHPMSGSNCICVVTALLETGRVPMVEPETVVRLDTAAGLITVRARCRDGRCLSVSLDNVPAFVQQLDAPVVTPKWGTIRADIAFGGVFYAQVDVDQVGLKITPDHARKLAEAGIEIKALLAEQVKVAHPEIPSLNEIAYVMFRDTQPDGSVTTCTTLKPGRVDRSPCGTGSSANLAVLHARGKLKVGETRTSQSIIGGTFLAEAIGETTVGGRPAVLPRITGQAWIFGRQELRISPEDPFKAGFALSDTWGPQVGEL
ncbi:Not a Proline racemase, nor 4-hydroxyproline epimerase (missing catalytic residues) [Rubellimicrobium mesophilum DSM 19309]|uniref:Not a Proline racemase, nor 4-hydroxyproline epimerase (Missing catalytic residues) n=1 Tax=Rubellimicrobium mesophilum DSM 19309 TaxID=442562 RepID=A0A017HT32_9RHOB|nr:proline racemase family protein [Rubellimicrobium mesophilum]EYD76914.1 Not a Proline racemase, nor 4-hydroxyproline epimerase (missing catalytic residues) [Rubellimicrobium mesophilum DSM 19309]